MGYQYMATISGLDLTIDMMRLDPPEHVRRILDETAGQLDAEIGERKHTLSDAQISPEVSAWLEKRLAGIHDITKKGARISGIDKPLYDEIERAILFKHAERIAAEKPRYRERLRRTAGVLAGTFGAITEAGPMWSKLDAYKAAKLWEEMTQAVMRAQVITWRAEEAMAEMEEADDE